MSAGMASAREIPALRQLWQTCFGDTPEYTDIYFSHSFQPERVFVQRQDARPVAMCISFPVSYLAPDGEEQQGAYLYAVATEPRFRGRGYCRSLLQYAQQVYRERGADFICLKPSSDALREMYTRFGYESSFTLAQRTVLAAPAPQLRCRRIDEQRYFNLRELLLRERFVSWSAAELAHQRRLCERSGGALYELSDSSGIGCAACEFDGGQLTVKEYLADESWLPGLVAACGSQTAAVRLMGEELPFAMCKALTGKPLPGGWLGFAFD